MNGAQALLTTFVDNGVDVCFANPGTSEMHFVAALDDVESMRAVLALFEGVATGAADGYARMTGQPAAVLLHLGPGLGNGQLLGDSVNATEEPVEDLFCRFVGIDAVAAGQDPEPISVRLAQLAPESEAVAEVIKAQAVGADKPVARPRPADT